MKKRAVLLVPFVFFAIFVVKTAKNRDDFLCPRSPLFVPA